MTTIRTVFCLALLLMLGGCLGLLVEAIELRGLMALGGRGLATRAAAGEMIAAAGGARVFAARAVSSNLGAVVLADEAMLAGGIRVLPVTVRGGGGRLAGTIHTEGKLVARVRMTGQSELRVVRSQRSATADGLTARHYDSAGQMVSYTRYSPDSLRFDYFVRVAEGQYKPAIYGLRSPATGDVTFFGPNHRYLGRAVYRRSDGRLVLAVAAGTALTVDLDERAESSGFNLCAQQYVLLRETHFQQNWDKSTVRQFWQSMYADCPANPEVRSAYQTVLFREAVNEPIRTRRIAMLRALLAEFPDNQDALHLLKRIE